MLFCAEYMRILLLLGAIFLQTGLLGFPYKQLGRSRIYCILCFIYDLNLVVLTCFPIHSLPEEIQRAVIDAQNKGLGSGFLFFIHNI